MVSPASAIADVSTGSQQPLLLRGGEVAALLGISRALAFRWMQQGILPTVRVPGCSKIVRVPAADLHKWIKNNTEKPAEKTQSIAEQVPSRRRKPSAR